MRHARTFFLCIALTLLLPEARADWRLGAETGSLFDSNLSNADRASDVKSDWAWKTEAHAGYGLQLARDLRLNAGFDMRSFVWGRFGSFDQIGAGFLTGLRYRFGLGAEAPWVQLENRIGYDRFRDAPLDRWDESLRLRGGVALSQRLNVEGGYTFENLTSPGDFFDQHSHRFDARLSFDLTSRLEVGIGYAYRNGDIISYAVPPRPDLFQIAPVRRGEDNFGTNPLTNAYRIRAQTHAVSVMAAYVLREYLSIEVSYEYAATMRDPLHYENHLVEAKIAFAY